MSHMPAMNAHMLFSKFSSAEHFQKKTSTNIIENENVYHHKMGFQRANPSIASTHSSSNTASGSLIILICLASAFMLLAILGTTFYYYHRKRSNSFNFNRSNHKVLLLKRELPLEKSFLINSFNGNSSTIGATGKTRAVRSPSSGQVNPFNKKTPSPVGCLKDTFPNANVSGIVNEGSTISQKNELTKTMNNEPEGGDVVRKINLPLEKASVLNSIENLNEKSVNRKDSGSSLISSVVPFKTKTLESEEPVSNDSKKLGQLHFKLKYSYDKKVLCLGVIRCTNLPAPKKDSNATIDPYVKLQLLPEKQHKAKTRVIRRSTNPVYNEEFTFYGITPNFLDNLVVHFVVLNFDRFARDEILGEVICKLNQLEFDSLEKQINLVRDISPRGNKLKIQELGEVLISLCYQPIANRLTVVILKARNLPKMDLTGLCDPYVKIYVYHNGQRIFKKRTHVKKRTLNPVFNESFVFDIPPDEGLDNIQIQFTVFDHDRVTRNELIGKIDIGCKSGNPITEKHWNEVIKAPRRQIAEWHKLKEC